MDILDILLDILLKPPQPFIGLFFWKLATNSLIWSVLQPRPAKAFCKAQVSPWLMKKAVKDSVVVTWAGLVGRVRCICFFACFGAAAPSTCWGLSSSEEYSNTTFLSTLPGVGFFFGLAFPLPIANGLPPVFFRAVCLVRAMHKSDLHLTFVR